MDSELTDCSLSNDGQDLKGSGEKIASDSPFPYTDIFYEHFPYYLSIGMTEDQYWDKDCKLTKYYREAEELRNEKFNQHAWLQGMYVYDAISRISPILQVNAKKGTKAQPYVEKPYPISKKSEQRDKEEKERVNAEKGKRYMEAFMVSNNKTFEDRK